MRVAYFGPEPTPVGGVPAMAFEMVLGLAAEGAEIDCYVTGPGKRLADRAGGLPIAIHAGVVHWSWGRWYSRNPLLAFITGQAARYRTQRGLAKRFIEHHRAAPYDVVYQFSQIESPGLRRYRRELPPLVVHPEVHAQGELRWAVRERALARRGGSTLKLAIAVGVLAVRSIVQRRDIRLARLVIAPSRAFAREIEHDYGVAADRLTVIANPIDLGAFSPPAETVARSPARILYVSRIAVRKGVELVTALSHRLDDLAGQVVIEVIGDRGLWSDYTALLADLNPGTAEQAGEVEAYDSGIL